jgi:BspA type Leucine rich repeat region (6 copies)
MKSARLLPFTFLAVGAAFCRLCSATAQAPFDYVINNGTITITKGCPITPGAVVIPETINGLPVAAIEAMAFFSCTNLTAIVVPDSVTDVGHGAFSRCISLTNAYLSKRISSIEQGTFEGCTRLATVSIPDSVSNIQFNAFLGCVSLDQVRLPNKVASLGNGAFFGCAALASISIPDSLTTIGSGTFAGCTSLTSIDVTTGHVRFSSVDGVLFNKDQTTLLQCPGGKAGRLTLPNSVSRIGEHAFSGCTSLASIVIPRSVAFIEDTAFVGCDRLEEISVDSGNPFFSSSDGVLFDKLQVTLIQCPGGKAGNYSPPDTVARIGNPGGFGFQGCGRLTGITIPNGVRSIPASAFSGCASLTNIAIPESTTSIENRAFFGCASLTSIIIPSGVTRIPESAFAGCISLTDIAIPSRVSWIDLWAFSGCTSLTGITIPNSVNFIGVHAFSGCSNLTSIGVDSTNPWFSSEDGVLFTKSQDLLIACPPGKAGQYSVPSKVSRIANHGFADCTTLTSVTLPNGIAEIGDFAFSGCTGLISVSLPDSVAYLGRSAMASCSSLASIKIPKRLSFLGHSVFSHCVGLANITVPSNITALGDRVFWGCTNLGAAYFQGNAPTHEPFSFHHANVTIHYLPGTKGWQPTYAGRPTALWTTPFLSFVRGQPGDSGFGLTISWAPNTTVVVEACQDLDSPVWLTVSINVSGDGSVEFRDQPEGFQPRRFYRVRTL